MKNKISQVTKLNWLKLGNLIISSKPKKYFFKFLPKNTIKKIKYDQVGRMFQTNHKQGYEV